MQLRGKQKGMTGLGWLTVLALIGFFSMLIIKLAPIYLENHSVKSTVESLAKEPFIVQKPIAEIRKLLQKRLKINYITDIGKENIKITKEDGVLNVEIAYEVREPMVANIDVVLSFSDKIRLVAN